VAKIEIRKRGFIMNLDYFKAKDNKGNEVNLEQYKGKVVLVVNTATKCGLTPQYEALEKLYEVYKDKGLEILDFPCNQFLKQAPGTDDEINDFCILNYQTKFPRFSKIDVNGPTTDPLFVWLKDNALNVKKADDDEAFKEQVKELNPFFDDIDIKWNFTKFLLDQEGNIVARYEPTFTPGMIEGDIKSLLK
jgi:glutathione peroxidase